MPYFPPIIASDMSGCQIRRSTTYLFTTSFVNITMDATDVENDPTTVAHDVGSTERINILATGNYLISYQFGTGTVATVRVTYGQVLQNAAVLPGSGASNADSTTTAGPSTVACSFIAALNAGDYLILQARNTAGTVSMPVGATLTAVRLTGAKGDMGPAGPSGVTPSVTVVTAGTSTSTITTTSTSDVLVTGMTVTPVAGTYLCFFTSAMEAQTNGNLHWASIWSGGSQISGSEITNANDRASPFCCVGTTVVNGAQTIEGRWRIASGTATMTGRRTLQLVKIG